MFFCGTGNVPDDAMLCRSRRPSKNHNPYADRGLDKFYALLADLDDEKQKIYTRVGSEAISFVRFVYANDDSNHVKPIVVKVKEKTRDSEKAKGNNNNNNPSPVVKRLATKNRIINEDKNEIVPERQKSEETGEKKKRYMMIRCNGKTWVNRLKKQPRWYLVVVVVLIMVLLAVFGRSFAILCTSIGWYLVPTVVGEASSSSSSVERKPKRKKEYTKKSISDTKMKNSQLGEDQSFPIGGLPNNRKIQKLQHGQKKKLLKLSTF